MFHYVKPEAREGEANLKGDDVASADAPENHTFLAIPAQFYNGNPKMIQAVFPNHQFQGIFLSVSDRLNKVTCAKLFGKVGWSEDAKPVEMFAVIRRLGEQEKLEKVPVYNTLWYSDIYNSARTRKRDVLNLIRNGEINGYTDKAVCTKIMKLLENRSQKKVQEVYEKMLRGVFQPTDIDDDDEEDPGPSSRPAKKRGV